MVAPVVRTLAAAPGTALGELAVLRVLQSRSMATGDEPTGQTYSGTGVSTSHGF
jgi:hypothetical protein